MNTKLVIGFGVIVLVVVGFIFKDVIKPTHSVAYYTEHKAEMFAKVKACNNDPATSSGDGNCINAKQAMSNHIFDEGKKNAESVRKAISSGF